MKVHFQDTRLFVNAGMSFPTCYANARLLDTDKSRLPMTVKKDEVTCKKCLYKLERGKNS